MSVYDFCELHCDSGRQSVSSDKYIATENGLETEGPYLRDTCDGWGDGTYVGKLFDRQDAVLQRLIVAHAHKKSQDDLIPGRLIPLLHMPTDDRSKFCSGT